MKLLVCLVLAVGLSACGGSGGKSGVGKYIYQDDAGIYHVDSDCRRLTNGKDEHGHEIYGKSLIDTATFVIVGKREFTVCSQCVGDVEYERLVAISNRNQGLQTKAGTSKMATLKEVYDAFKADGAPLPDTYKAFETYMTSGPNGGYDHRKQWYDAFKADGAPLPDTYEQFSEALFAAKIVRYKPRLETIYKMMRETYRGMPDTYEEFEATFTAPGEEGAKNRIILYKSLRENWSGVPESYGDFVKILFVAVDSFERLYDKLWRENYIETGKDEFMSFVYAPDDRGYKNRRSLYERLRNDGRIADSTYEAFASRIGLHARSQLPEKLRVEELQ